MKKEILIEIIEIIKKESSFEKYSLTETLLCEDSVLRTGERTSPDVRITTKHKP